MSTCSPDGLMGFVNLSGGPPTPTILSNITVKGYPLTVGFAPRTTAPTLNGNLIQGEGTDTLQYKGTTYTLQNAQFNNPTHIGYVPNQSIIQCELSLTFYNPQVIGTYPSVILLIVPIMTGNSDIRMTYIQNILNPTTDVSDCSLQSIFEDNSVNTMVSYGYKPCISLSSLTTPYTFMGSLNTYVLYFSNGITMTQGEASDLNMLVTASLGGNAPYPAFELPPSVLNGMATVLSLVETDGTMMPSTVDASGTLGSSQASVSSTEFTTLFQYFNQSPGITNTPPVAFCPSYTTTQYQCLPFSKFYDISNNVVSRKLSDILPGSSGVLPDSSTEFGIEIFIDVLIGLIVFLLIVFLVYIICSSVFGSGATSSTGGSSSAE